MENYIGKVISFDEATAIKITRIWQTLFPEIISVKSAYEDLDTKWKFTQDVYDDIVKNKLINITKAYNKNVDEQISNMKITSKAIAEGIRNNINKHLTELSVAVENFFNKVNRAAAGNITSLPIEFADIKIINGLPVIDEASEKNINKRLSIIIETEQQSELYSVLVDVQKSYSKLNDIVAATGRDIKNVPIISDYINCYLNQTTEGLAINPNCINFI